MGFYIYLYNVFFLCLFACAAFFCGVTKGMTESKRFAYLSMGSCLAGPRRSGRYGIVPCVGDVLFGRQLWPPWCFDPFGIAKTLSQMGEEILFYLLACDVTKRTARSALFLLFPVLALVRCLAGTVYLGIVPTLYFSLSIPWS